MPRIAASAHTIADFAIPSPLLEPPADLSEEAAVEWRAIVGGLPAEWFRSDQRPAMRELCRHVIYARQIAEQLAGMRQQCLTAATAAGDKVRDIFGKLLKLQGEETRLIVLLSVRLGLLPGDQPEKRRREALRARAVNGPKPWEGWSHRDETGDGKN